ncbi:MAG: rhodanese-like domain-containing protein [Deltaproteobacteria bacterium]|nr:rhodanese-like domain-containing protein [Deltaproteobacteria bacterium]
MRNRDDKNDGEAKPNLGAPRRRALFAIAFAFVAGGFGLWEGGQRSASAHAEAQRLVAAGATLIDVRTTQEFEAGHIPGAVHVPVHEIEARAHELGPKTRPVVVYCRSGNRSARAARMLRARGFTEVFDLGAMSRWSQGTSSVGETETTRRDGVQ